MGTPTTPLEIPVTRTLRRPLTLSLAVLTLSLSGLGASTAFAADEAWVGEARGVATAVPPKLLAVLREAIDQSGPAGAIGVCREKAPAMAKAASEQTGWQIRRVSLGQRNPKAAPDAWEAATLADFDRRAAAGENPAQLERHETVVTDGVPMQRYMRALPVQELCINCHGTPDKLAAGVAARLSELYPADRGTGYSVGQIRGAMTIKRPAP